MWRLSANDTAIIAAQELIDLPSSYVWVDSMAKHPIIQIAGYWK